MLVERVLGVVASVSCNDRVYHMQKLWFWGNFMHSEG